MQFSWSCTICDSQRVLWVAGTVHLSRVWAPFPRSTPSMQCGRAPRHFLALAQIHWQTSIPPHKHPVHAPTTLAPFLPAPHLLAPPRVASTSFPILPRLARPRRTCTKHGAARMSLWSCSRYSRALPMASTAFATASMPIAVRHTERCSRMRAASAPATTCGRQRDPLN